MASELSDRVGAAVDNLNDAAGKVTSRTLVDFHKLTPFFTTSTTLAAFVLAATSLADKPSQFTSAWSVLVLVLSICAMIAIVAQLVRRC